MGCDVDLAARREVALEGVPWHAPKLEHVFHRPSSLSAPLNVIPAFKTLMVTPA
jgi:hypothetical protein